MTIRPQSLPAPVVLLLAVPSKKQRALTGSIGLARGAMSSTLRVTLDSTVSLMNATMSADPRDHSPKTWGGRQFVRRPGPARSIPPSKSYRRGGNGKKSEGDAENSRGFMARRGMVLSSALERISKSTGSIDRADRIQVRATIELIP